VEEEAR